MEARHQLVARRKAAGYSQERMAARLAVNPSTYNRWEVGRATPRDRHRPGLAEVLGLTLEELDLLLDNRLGTETWPHVSGHQVPIAQTLYASLEQGAGRIETVVPAVIPGLLQTRDYATALMRGHFDPLSDSEVENLVGFRLARQRVLDRLPVPPIYHCIVDGSALHRVVGSAEVMAAQIDHLVDLASRPRVEIRVVPAWSSAMSSNNVGEFTLFSAEGAENPYVLCTEDLAGVQYHDARDMVDRYVRLLHYLRAEALSTEGSIGAVLRARGAMV